MFKDFDDAQAQLWPHSCPACGYAAFIGMNQVKCVTVGSCMNFDQKESDRWVSIRDELEPTEPLLSLPGLDEANLFIHANPQNTVMAKDWHQVVERDAPIHDNGKGEWTYQLPAGSNGRCNVGMRHHSSNGIDYCIVSMDRFADTITIAWDKRVQQGP